MKYTSVKVYGRETCPRTTDVRAHLEKLGIDHEYIDISRDEDAARCVRERAEGKEKTPTFDIAGDVLVDPTDEQYNGKLRAKGISRDQGKHTAK